MNDYQKNIKEYNEQILAFIASTLTSLGAVILIYNKKRRYQKLPAISISTSKNILIMIRLSNIIIAIYFVIIAYEAYILAEKKTLKESIMEEYKYQLLATVLSFLAALASLNVIESIFLEE
ncbi:MAG: hypothetical protein Q4G04_06710 [bacterium]|nr:hypothetical protein [bacterium]